MLCAWARHFAHTVPLSAQEYKWVPANCQGSPINALSSSFFFFGGGGVGGNLAMDQHLI